MSGKEVVKRLKKLGWKVDRIHGSHYIMVKGSQSEAVPVHGNKDLPIGLLKAIAKRTGLKLN